MSFISSASANSVDVALTKAIEKASRQYNNYKLFDWSIKEISGKSGGFTGVTTITVTIEHQPTDAQEAMGVNEEEFMA